LQVDDCTASNLDTHQDPPNNRTGISRGSYTGQGNSTTTDLSRIFHLGPIPTIDERGNNWYPDQMANQLTL
jgi:hypothetical protein